MNGTTELLFGALHNPAEVSSALEARYNVIAEPAASETWIWLDTADWRLHRAGMTLRDRRRGRSGELVLSVDGDESVTAPSGTARWPRRVEALPPSPVRDYVATTVGVRALLPLAAVETRSQRMRLLDDADKTRVWVQVDQQQLAGANGVPLPLRVMLTALRGYERDARRCAELLTSRLAAAEVHTGSASAAFAASGLERGRTRTASLAIDAQDPAARSVAEILRSFLGVIDANRAGVLDDVDVEYLHELRTAVRATRSILMLTGDVLPSGRTEGFAEEFAWLGRLSTPVRDLDVLLLELRGAGSVDTDGLAGLEPLRQLLVAQRRHALGALRAGLLSPRGEDLTDRWRQALDEITAASTAAAVTTGDIAVTRARRAYKRIGKAASGVTAATPADDLHRLRRRCKQMRYLLDGFGPVYEPQAHRTVLTALKRLQDDLGDIQDSDVQRNRLTAAAARLASRDAPIEAVLAIGALQDRIAGRDRAARAELDSRLARITGAGLAARVAALQASSS